MSRQPDARLRQALDLVAKFYEAAADVQAWPLALAALSDATCSEATILWMHDFADASARLDAASFACNVRFAAGFMDRYAEHYTYVNPWMKSIERLAEGEVANSSDFVPDTELHGTEFYADWLQPQGLGYALEARYWRVVVASHCPACCGPLGKVRTAKPKCACFRY